MPSLLYYLHVTSDRVRPDTPLPNQICAHRNYCTIPIPPVLAHFHSNTRPPKVTEHFHTRNAIPIIYYLHVTSDRVRPDTPLPNQICAHRNYCTIPIPPVL